MKHVLGGLAIAVPACRVLLGTDPASANSDACKSGSQSLAPQQGCPEPCAKVYIEYNGHHCANNILGTTCAGPLVAHCIGVYYKYDSNTGDFCGSFEDDEGYCDG
jgi:hypothetical protein